MDARVPVKHKLVNELSQLPPNTAPLVETVKHPVGFKECKCLNRHCYFTLLIYLLQVYCQLVLRRCQCLWSHLLLCY